MSRAPLDGVVQYLRRIVSPPGSHLVPDAELLERFVSRHDEAAFELLVWRHGKMVFGVCRRVLLDGQEAEDAFQATFLALARRAASIRKGSSVGGWLYKVAYRTALAARERAAKRTVRERPLQNAPAPPRADPAVCRKRRTPLVQAWGTPKAYIGRVSESRKLPAEAAEEARQPAATYSAAKQPAPHAAPAQEPTPAILRWLRSHGLRGTGSRLRRSRGGLGRHITAAHATPAKQATAADPRLRRSRSLLSPGSRLRRSGLLGPGWLRSRGLLGTGRWRLLLPRFLLLVCAGRPNAQNHGARNDGSTQNPFHFPSSSC